MEDGHLLRFRLYKVLHGPVQQSFVYTFHQTYTQDTDVYSYVVGQSLSGYFSEIELASLQLEKRSSRRSLPLLFKILKTCCTPSLAATTSPRWKNNRISAHDLDSESLESLLASLMSMYEDLSSVREPIDKGDYDYKITFAKNCLEKLIEMAGKFDITGRWGENLERIMSNFEEITSGQRTKAAPHEEISEDIKVELEMQYQCCQPPVLNPLKLHITEAIKLPSKRNRKTCNPVLGEKVAVKDILTSFNKEPAEGEMRRVCLVRSIPGLGRSSLAELLASSWKHKDNRISHISKYEAVIIFSAALGNVTNKDIVEIALPLCVLTHGAAAVYTWLKKASVLLIIDDAEELDSKHMDELKGVTEQACSMNIVMLCVPEGYDRIQECWSSYILCKLQLNGYDREEIVNLAEELLHQRSRSDDVKELKAFLMKNMCRLSLILKHPTTLVQVCEAWMATPSLFDNVSTVTDLLWMLTIRTFRKIIETSFQDDQKETKEHQWLMAVGSIALSAFKENKRLEGEYMIQLHEETSKIYPADVNQFLIKGLFVQRNRHVNNHKGELSSVHTLQQEFLAAWYVAHMILDGKKYRSLTGDGQCLYQLSLFIGGHMSRINKGKRIMSELDERRLICAIVNHSEDSFENLTFNLELVTEIKAAPKLVEYIVEVSEYPEEWNVCAADIQLIPLETLLMNVAPIRIFLNVEKLKPFSELQKVLAFLCRVDIFVWLDSSCQFKYGEKGSMDRIVKAFFKDTVMTKIDLISGVLSNEVLQSIVNCNATKHLVYLKLRVQDFKTLSTVLIINKYLPKLLWLEVKIDYPILKGDIEGLPCTTVPMLDVYIQNINDKSVSKLANLLGSMHIRYTGIHLENTSLTPEGLFVLLKQLQKRNICLYSEPEARDKFRRWYYPQFYNMHQSEVLTDEMAEEALGFDDRIYYSNHYVDSSCFALALDAWNLTSYLEEQEEILHFTYKTENLSFIKGLNGSVDIEVNKKDET
nr:uncharacterized protein LOC113827920 [Penaeus vannamei]